jgi:hypothetical protein
VGGIVNQKPLYQPGDTMHLIRDPSTKGFIQYVYERNVLLVKWLDGSTELCQPEEIEPN